MEYGSKLWIRFVVNMLCRRISCKLFTAATTYKYSFMVLLSCRLCITTVSKVVFYNFTLCRRRSASTKRKKYLHEVFVKRYSGNRKYFIIWIILVILYTKKYFSRNMQHIQFKIIFDFQDYILYFLVLLFAIHCCFITLQ